jgi:hypothetical protein
MENALVHHVGDVDALTEQITMLYNNRELLDRLRNEALRSAPEMTWAAAGERLLQAYSEIIVSKK